MKLGRMDELVFAIEEQHGWDKLFREIKATSAAYDLSCRAARSQENRTRNRYRDVSPYDHSRVKLVGGQNDYINGNLVEVESIGRSYILAQGPLPNTSGHMWQMIWEQNSKAVIMLNKIIEKGTTKCDQYWPINPIQPLCFLEDGYEVALLNEKDNMNYIVRELELRKLKSSEPPRIIYQFHYIAWPDFGVPESPTAFLDFLACVREHGVLDSNVGPPVIHCSAGIGRSGTFALVDTCLVYLKMGLPFDVREILLEMRKYRMGLIQTPQQLRFSYLAIAQCERILKQVTHSNDESENSISSTSESEGEEEEKEEEPKQEDQAPEETPPEESDPEEPKENNRKRHAEPEHSVEEKRGKQENNIPEATPAEPVVLENNNVKEGLRQRTVAEKKAELKERIEKIKSNMKESENQSPWKRYIIGGIIATVVVGFAVRYWYG
uniref:tyrosine-protein phosphatase non-receptor type 2-like n=1 Tax=Ciona intestinalis TaxID=7719 RepID=UPI000180C55D|nr:tyrosine-protein phosphatase non-receptor type 2-like [Ciona intestinalis]|eukprot:XP_002129090.1 tyrosine-protein phosphatase non-receptor type 2-like [Ciona intestinalis]